MRSSVIEDTSNYKIGRYRRRIIHDDQGDLNPGEQDQAINHVLRIASGSDSGVAAFEAGVDGEYGAFVLSVRLDQLPSKTIHVTVYRRQVVTG